MSPRQFAIDVVQRLRGAGYLAYWAGGCVRDELLGRTPKDYDVATSAEPEQVREVFGRRQTLAVGASFGVIIVRGPREAGQIDVATFREDAGYSDGRRPDAVHYSTPELDAQRRDFTINGLFFDPLAEQVIDFVGGQADLQRGMVRAIGDARQRFTEDKLRLLRAVRFTAAFGFELEEATEAAIVEMADQLTVVSAERIGMELRQMLLYPPRRQAIELLLSVQLLPVVLPEVAQFAATQPERWNQTLGVLERLHEPTAAVALAAILRGVSAEDLGLPIAHRLKWTNKEGERTRWLLQHEPLLPGIDQLPWPQVQRILIEEGMPELLALTTAIAGPENAQVRWCRERLAWPTEKLNPAPLLTGNELRKAGMKPGPYFKTLLDVVRDAQLSGQLQTLEEALAYAERFLAEQEGE